MRRAIVWTSVLLTVALGLETVPAAVGKSGRTQVRWIDFQNGRLAYGSDQYGNRVPDFSAVGYETGLQPIPAVPVRSTIDPAVSGDDTPRGSRQPSMSLRSSRWTQAVFAEPYCSMRAFIESRGRFISMRRGLSCADRERRSMTRCSWRKECLTLY